jgi:hypothetical protein
MIASLFGVASWARCEVALETCAVILTSPRVRSPLRFPTSGPVGSRHPFGSEMPAGAALSAPLQGGLRFLRHRLPATPSPSLAVGIPPRWGVSGLPSCRPRRMWSGEVGVSTPVGFKDASHVLEPGDPTHVPFWSRPHQPLWPSPVYGA